MQKVILHIGLHKTATTFFQEKIWPNLKTYTYLTRPLTQFNHAFNKLQYADDSLYSKEIMLNELKHIDYDNLLISDESLSGKPLFFSYLNRSIIANRMKELFPNAVIILFIRDQKDIMVSHYSTYVKVLSGTRKIQDLFHKIDKDLSYSDYVSNPGKCNFNTLYYNTNDWSVHVDCFLYSHLLKLYTDLFPRVEVFLYEDFVRNKDAALKRLEAIVGEKFDVNPDILERKVNKSFDFQTIERKRILNQYKPMLGNKLFKKGIDVLANSSLIKSSNVNLAEVISRHVGDYYLEDNKVIKNQYPDLNWDAYPEKYI